jgi:hypothetical protein
MGKLVFLQPSYAYRHAAVAAFRKARALPIGAERNEHRVLARSLTELARTEAWLEGQNFRSPRFLVSERFCTRNLSRTTVTI